jgi:polyferredoxin
LLSCLPFSPRLCIRVIYIDIYIYKRKKIKKRKKKKENNKGNIIIKTLFIYSIYIYIFLLYILWVSDFFWDDVVFSSWRISL